MKKAKADRIMWDVGWWHQATARTKRRWNSRRLYQSRADARVFKMSSETIRRCEVFYVD